jgi:hypothetical protein
MMVIQGKEQSLFYRQVDELTLIFERLPLLQHDLLIDVDENIVEVLKFARIEFAGETGQVIGDRIPCSCQERAGMLDSCDLGSKPGISLLIPIMSSIECKISGPNGCSGSVKSMYDYQATISRTTPK